MALDFGLYTDDTRCIHTTSCRWSSVGKRTFLCWVLTKSNCTSDGVVLLRKDGALGGTQLLLNGSAYPLNIDIYTEGGNYGQRLNAKSNTTPVVADKLQIVGARYDTSGAAGDQGCFYGTREEQIAEVTGYGTQLVGGSHKDLLGEGLTTGCAPGGAVWARAEAVFYFGAIWDAYLTLAEMRAFQVDPWRPPRRGSLILYTRYGLDGLGLQKDLSPYRQYGELSGGDLTQFVVRSHHPFVRPQRGFALKVPVVAANNLQWKLAATRPSLAGAGGLAG